MSTTGANHQNDPYRLIEPYVGFCRLEEGTLAQTRTQLQSPTASPPRPTGRARRDELNQPSGGGRKGGRKARLGPRLDPRSVTGLGRLGPLVTFLRWASLAVGVALAPTTGDATDPILLVSIGVLLANTIFRTIRPLRLQPATWRAEATLLADLALPVFLITLTGDWASPLILTPLPTVILAAYGWGYREGLAAAVLIGATIGMVDVLSGVSEDALRTGVLASVVVILAALVVMS